MSAAPPLGQGQAAVQVRALRAGRLWDADDALAVEEPLEIRVRGSLPLVTMRTPGHDLELAAGLMLGEGLARGRDDFLRLEPRGSDSVRVHLRGGANAGRALARSGLISSACGVCGKTSLDRTTLSGKRVTGRGPLVQPADLLELPERLRRAQGLFQRTGGLHAAALFSPGGALIAIREDVGRHNALDKLNGYALLADLLPLHRHIVVLSGRASYELVQKSIMAGAAIVCSISAPSSYAVKLAREFGLTLVGFLREERFNVYAGAERIG